MEVDRTTIGVGALELALDCVVSPYKVSRYIDADMT